MGNRIWTDGLYTIVFGKKQFIKKHSFNYPCVTILKNNEDIIQIVTCISDKKTIENLQKRLDGNIKKLTPTKFKWSRKKFDRIDILFNCLGITLQPKHPHVYAIMALLNKKSGEVIRDIARRRFDGAIKKYVPIIWKGGLAPPHISLIYLSYPNKYTKRFLSVFLPKIKKILARLLPMKLSMKGFYGAWEIGWQLPVLLCRIESNKKLIEARQKLINLLNKKIPHLTNQDYFEMHIGVLLIKKNSIGRVIPIVHTQRKETLMVKFDRGAIYFAEGLEEISIRGHNSFRRAVRGLKKLQNAGC